MDYTNAALTYGLLLLPTCFALAVLGQGINKMRKGENGAKAILIFGIFLILLVPLTYIFLIRI